MKLFTRKKRNKSWERIPNSEEISLPDVRLVYSQQCLSSLANLKSANVKLCYVQLFYSPFLIEPMLPFLRAKMFISFSNADK